VHVTVAEGERRPPRAIRWIIVALSVILTSGGVLLGARFLVDAEATVPSRAPAAALDARSATPAPDTAAADIVGAVRDSTRFVPMEPTLALDTRGLGALRPGAEVTVQLRDLPTGATAVLTEVSLLAATGAGDVTIDGGAGRRTVLRAPRAGAQLSTTVVVRIGPDATLRVRTGGGHLLVNLVGAFQPVQVSSAGRIVPVPAVPVLRLVPRTDGNDATIRLSDVPALRRAGPISALLLQIAGDVGSHGGSVAVGSAPGGLNQTIFWNATSGTDRTRGGFVVVPVPGGSLQLRYKAGTEMRADLVGYVTGDGAAMTDAGLVVPVPPPATRPVRIAAGAGADVEVIPTAGIADVPADQVAATLLTVAATGDAVGGVTVHAPGSSVPANPTLIAPRGATRSALTLVGVVAGDVRIVSAAGASVTATPQAVVLGS
jgi:hypothetical protein